jgi:hypothetical protein
MFEAIGDILAGALAGAVLCLFVWRGFSNALAGVANTKKRMGKQD